MIKELVQFTELLDPDVFKWNFKPAEGIHLFVEFHEGNWLPLIYEYYNGKSPMNTSLVDVLEYQQATDYISMNKVKSFDPKQKIHSCSPFALAFNFNINKDVLDSLKKRNPTDEYFDLTKKHFRISEEIKPQINLYFKNCREIFLEKTEENLEIWSKKFEEYCQHQFFEDFLKIEIQQKDRTGKATFKPILEVLGDKSYVRLYIKNIPLEKYKEIYGRYKEDNLFLKPKNTEYNYPKTLNPEFSLGNFLINDNEKMPFLRHHSAPFFINFKQSKKEVKALFQLEELLCTKPSTLPNPLPVFVYKEELNNEVLLIFKGEDEKKKGYAEILRELAEKHKTDLSDYYLINFANTKDGLVLKDFDFVPLFKYWLFSDKNNNPGWEIINLLKARSEKEIKHYAPIKCIFDFERLLNEHFFYIINQKTGFHKPFLIGKYFSELEADKGHELRAAVQHNLHTFRSAIYDFIYKSRTSALNHHFWYTVGITIILDEIKTDQHPYKNEFRIKEKLNYWFSLNRHFDSLNLNFNGTDMASQIPNLLDRTRIVANNDFEHFISINEFAFGAGQIIYYLFSKSEAGEKSHAILEPFLQKQNVELLKAAITQIIIRYKHAIDFGHGRFERLAKEVLGFEDTDVNMLKYVPVLLAGYFSENIIYEKKQTLSK
jgi:CRISPR-associated protein Csh1